MMPARTLSIGIVTPMRPVEPTSAVPAATFNARSRERHHFARVAIPCLPVQALALPELTTTACADALLHALDANFHRRGANLIRREHAGDGRRRFGNDQREVAFLAFVRAFAGAEPFDVAKNAAGHESLSARRWNREFL